MRLEDYDIETKYTATVKETARITPEEAEDEIRNIVLEVDAKDFKFDIGQSIGVLVPGPPTRSSPRTGRIPASRFASNAASTSTRSAAKGTKVLRPTSSATASRVTSSRSRVRTA